MIKEVKVKWVDSKFYSHEWLSAEDASHIDLGYCETYGFLIFENDRRIIIAQTQNIDCETFHNLMIIPRACIKEINESSLDKKD